MKLKSFIMAALLSAAMPVAATNTIGTIVYNLGDIDGNFKELHTDGFTSCEINWNRSMCTPELAKKIKEASKKYNIKVTTIVGVPGHCEWNFTGGPQTIGLVPEEGREEKMKELKEMIDFCKLADVPAMHTHFGFIPENPNSPEYKSFIPVLQDLARYAKEKDILIYFETGQETPTTLIRAIKDSGMDNLFINCDVANLMLYGKANPVDAIRQFGPLVKEIHAKDGFYPDRNNPNELGREVPIPTGAVDFPGVVRELKKLGFEGAYTIEYELNDGSRDYLVNTRKYLQNLIDNE